MSFVCVLKPPEHARNIVPCCLCDLKPSEHACKIVLSVQDFLAYARKK